MAVSPATWGYRQSTAMAGMDGDTLREAVKNGDRTAVCTIRLNNGSGVSKRTAHLVGTVTGNGIEMVVFRLVKESDEPQYFVVYRHYREGLADQLKPRVYTANGEFAGDLTEALAGILMADRLHGE
jgi:hypothetical protein